MDMWLGLPTFQMFAPPFPRNSFFILRFTKLSDMFEVLDTRYDVQQPWYSALAVVIPESGRKLRRHPDSKTNHMSLP